MTFEPQSWGCEVGRRVGRKRKVGPRHPGGQLKHVKPDLATRTSRQPHRRGLKDALRRDERAGEPLGRMYLRGLIDNDAYDAGSRYAFLVGQYRASIGAQSGGQGSGRGGGCSLDRTDGAKLLISLFGKDKVVTSAACLDDPDGCACLKRRTRYMQAYESLASARLDGDQGPTFNVGRRIVTAVNRVVVQGEELQGEETVYLVAGLKALARHFGLTRAPNRAHHHNAH